MNKGLLMWVGWWATATSKSNLLKRESLFEKLTMFQRLTISLIFYFCVISNLNAKKNVLFIIIDDLRHLPTESVTLPNIGKMADKGAYFKLAFAQQALCAPSRNSLLTGRRPDSLRLYDFFNYWRDTVGNFTTIPQFFKENGYKTISVGKVFHPGLSSNFTDDYPYSWSKPPYHPSTEKYKDAAVCEDENTKKLQKNLICPVRVDKQPGKTLPDMESLDYAINFLMNSSTDKPYFLAVGFHKPHIPIKFPKKFLSKIPISKVSPPPYPDIPKHLPLPAWHPWTDVRHRDDIHRLNISYPFGIMPPTWALKIRQSYYAASLYVDSLVGALMKHVDVMNTVVVLTSDHGWSLGENGLWAKYSNFNVALRVPLIFIAPQIYPTVISTPVELIDIFPTLTYLAGLKHNIPQCKNHKDKTILCFEGKNIAFTLKSQIINQYHNINLEKSDMTQFLLPTIKSLKTTQFTSHGITAYPQNLSNILTSKRHKNTNFALSQYPRPSVYPRKNSDKPRLKDIKIMGYTIRTKRYRYTEWTSFNNTTFKIHWNQLYGLELYDHIVDQYETNNLYLVSKYDKVKKKLSKLLRSHVNN